jgi:sugar/nucleoside kinase (ribokinase family)
MFDLMAIGGATRDIFFEFSNLAPEKENKRAEAHLVIPYGEKMVSEGTFYGYGGGAVNVAVCGARLGLKTASVCNIGREGTGSVVLSFLKSEGVNTTGVSRDAHLHTGLSILIVGKDGEHTGFLERGANNHLYLKKPTVLKKTKWIYLSSLTGESEKIIPEVFARAEKYQTKVAFNPGSKQLKEGYHFLKNYLPLCEILILNIEEATELVFSKTKKEPKDEQEILRELEAMGPRITVVTDGSKGSHAISEGKIYHERSLSTKVIDTTGAGDAFGGTFVFAQIKGQDIATSLEFAAKNSASVVSKMGASAGLLSYNTLVS